MDNSIPVNLSIERLKFLANPRFEYKVFPDEGHNLADSLQQPSHVYLVTWVKNTARRMRTR